MTRTLIQLTMAAALAAGAAFPAMFPPREGDLAASIPFEFVAGGQTMPAGEYMVRTHPNGEIEICEDGVYCVVVVTNVVCGPRAKGQTTLVFRQGGSERLFVGIGARVRPANASMPVTDSTVAARELCVHNHSANSLPTSWH